MMRQDRGHMGGFTLIELVVIVVVMGILASLAYPNYVQTRERTVDREAQAALMLIRNGQRMFFSRFESFYPATGGTVANIDLINGNLTLDLNTRQWAYSVSCTPPTFFLAQATRSGRTWSLDNTANTPVCAGACL